MNTIEKLYDPYDATAIHLQKLYNVFIQCSYNSPVKTVQCLHMMLSQFTYKLHTMPTFHLFLPTHFYPCDACMMHVLCQYHYLLD